VTVDTVRNCTLRLPGDPGYFGPGGTGDATDQNVLWGDYFYVDSAQNFADGETLVHIEASATDPETTTPGEYTFYGRYVAWAATDNREPLSTNFAVRYVNGGVFNGGSDLIVWRDSKVNQAAFACPVVARLRPAWYPLGEEEIVIFDEQETPEVPQTFPFSPQPPEAELAPFPAEAQRTKIGGIAFPVPFDFGWLSLNLNTVVAAAIGDPPEDPLAAQAWVTVEMFATEVSPQLAKGGGSGRFSGGFAAVRKDSASTAMHKN
jgi:hypothetical protein